MKTSSDVLNELFVLLNVAAVTSLIDGTVCRRRKPLGQQGQDVVIVPLDLRNHDSVQPGMVVINCYAQNHENGLPNETKLTAVSQAVIALIDGYSKGASSFFEAEAVSENLFQDQDDPMMSYASIRVRFTIENS